MNCHTCGGKGILGGCGRDDCDHMHTLMFCNDCNPTWTQPQREWELLVEDEKGWPIMTQGPFFVDFDGEIASDLEAGRYLVIPLPKKKEKEE